MKNSDTRDFKLYKSLMSLGMARVISFDIKDDFEKAQKFLTYIDYNFETTGKTEEDSKYYIHLSSFTVIPATEKGADELVNRYMDSVVGEE